MKKIFSKFLTVLLSLNLVLSSYLPFMSPSIINAYDATALEPRNPTGNYYWICSGNSIIEIDPNGIPSEKEYCSRGCSSKYTEGYQSDAECNPELPILAPEPTPQAPAPNNNPHWYCQGDTIIQVNTDGTAFEYEQCGAGNRCRSKDTPGYQSDAECYTPEPAATPAPEPTPEAPTPTPAPEVPTVTGWECGADDNIALGQALIWENYSDGNRKLNQVCGIGQLCQPTGVSDAECYDFVPQATTQPAEVSQDPGNDPSPSTTPAIVEESSANEDISVWGNQQNAIADYSSNEDDLQAKKEAILAAQRAQDPQEPQQTVVETIDDALVGAQEGISNAYGSAYEALIARRQQQQEANSSALLASMDEAEQVAQRSDEQYKQDLEAALNAPEEEKIKAMREALKLPEGGFDDEQVKNIFQQSAKDAGIQVDFGAGLTVTRPGLGSLSDFTISTSSSCVGENCTASYGELTEQGRKDLQAMINFGLDMATFGISPLAQKSNELQENIDQFDQLRQKRRENSLAEGLGLTRRVGLNQMTDEEIQDLVEETINNLNTGSFVSGTSQDQQKARLIEELKLERDYNNLGTKIQNEVEEWSTEASATLALNLVGAGGLWTLKSAGTEVAEQGVKTVAKKSFWEGAVDAVGGWLERGKGEDIIEEGTESLVKSLDEGEPFFAGADDLALECNSPCSVGGWLRKLIRNEGAEIKPASPYSPDSGYADLSKVKEIKFFDNPDHQVVLSNGEKLIISPQAMDRNGRTVVSAMREDGQVEMYYLSTSEGNFKQFVGIRTEDGWFIKPASHVKTEANVPMELDIALKRMFSEGLVETKITGKKTVSILDDAGFLYENDRSAYKAMENRLSSMDIKPATAGDRQAISNLTFDQPANPILSRDGEKIDVPFFGSECGSSLSCNVTIFVNPEEAPRFDAPVSFTFSKVGEPNTVLIDVPRIERSNEIKLEGGYESIRDHFLQSSIGRELKRITEGYTRQPTKGEVQKFMKFIESQSSQGSPVDDILKLNDEGQWIPSQAPSVQTNYLDIGSQVRVQRSSGAIDQGWVINGLNPRTGDVVVSKREGGNTLVKEISISDLERLNKGTLNIPSPVQPVNVTNISSASNLDDVMRRVEAQGGSYTMGNGYPGSARDVNTYISMAWRYSVDYGLNDRVQAIINTLPAGEIRDTVQKLIEKSVKNVRQKSFNLDYRNNSIQHASGLGWLLSVLHIPTAYAADGGEEEESASTDRFAINSVMTQKQLNLLKTGREVKHSLELDGSISSEEVRKLLEENLKIKPEGVKTKDKIVITTGSGGWVEFDADLGAYRLDAPVIKGIKISLPATLNVTKKGQMVPIGVNAGKGEVSKINFEDQKDLNASEDESKSKIRFAVFYDKNNNGKLDQDEELVPWAGVTIKMTKVIQEKEIALNNGWNLVTLTALPSSAMTASTLLSEIAKQGGYATTVSVLENGFWKSYVERSGKAYSGDDFAIEPGKAYFVKAEKKSTFTFEGQNFVAPVKLKLASGWNAVGLPFTSKSYKAAELIDTLNNSKLPSDTAARWESGLWDTLVKKQQEEYGENFVIAKNRGYLVKLEQGGEFSP